MNYWIFIVKGQTWDSETHTGEEIFHQRMKDQFWGFGERTPNRQNLSQGDKVVFYIGVPQKCFGGIAALASSSFTLDNSQREEYGHGTEFYENDYGVFLKDVETWPATKSIEELVPSLRFIENKDSWGAYLQGGIRQISEEDFKTIIGERSLVEPIVPPKGIESQSEFALEIHLEDFIYANWGKINWGSKLELYKAGEQNGRQFPAGPWSIDFLAVNKDTNDLVVIELKKGRPSDAVVGQIQAYINWVKEKVADVGQNVRGIIICKKEVDDRLKYAVKNLDYIEIRTYKVDFQLSQFQKGN